MMRGVPVFSSHLQRPPSGDALGVVSLYCWYILLIFAVEVGTCNCPIGRLYLLSIAVDSCLSVIVHHMPVACYQNEGAGKLNATFASWYSEWCAVN